MATRHLLGMPFSGPDELTFAHPAAVRRGLRRQACITMLRNSLDRELHDQAAARWKNKPRGEGGSECKNHMIDSGGPGARLRLPLGSVMGRYGGSATKRGRTVFFRSEDLAVGTRFGRPVPRTWNRVPPPFGTHLIARAPTLTIRTESTSTTILIAAGLRARASFCERQRFRRP
jgi:hypothetical protein